MSFTGALVVNADRITPRKSILICGMARAGTSFGASVFVRLGVPFWRPDERELHGTYEHKKLRNAVLEDDFDTVGALAADFSDRFPVWGWKLPAIQRHFERIGQCVPNPHFVMVFKEMLSVVARKNALDAKDTIGRMVDVAAAYQRMMSVVAETKHPCLLVSYDRAMANLEAFIGDAASYAGVSQCDATAVTAAIHEDQLHYLRAWERVRQKRLEPGGRKRRSRGEPLPSAAASI